MKTTIEIAMEEVFGSASAEVPTFDELKAMDDDWENTLAERGMYAMEAFTYMNHKALIVAVEDIIYSFEIHPAEESPDAQ